MPKPATLVTDLAHLPTVLVEHLVKLERWCIWRWEEKLNKKGELKWTKVPYQARFPQQCAATNNPRTWARYDEAVAAATSADGIGFMLRDCDIAAADLDKVRNKDTGDLVSWVQPLVLETQQLSLYVEITVSGTGLRFVGLAPNGIRLHKKYTFDTATKEGIELYRNCERYITVSGAQYGACASLGNIDAYLDDLKKRFGDRKSRKLNLNQAKAAKPTHTPDYYEDLIKNGPPPGGNRSDLFQSVVWHLANRGWSVDQITDELGKYPNGIAEKYVGRLRQEVERCYDKWQAQLQGVPSQGGGPTGGSQGGASPTGPTPMPTPMPAAANWRQYLQRDRRGKPLSNLANTMVPLRNEPLIKDLFAYDEMYCDVMMVKTLAAKSVNLVPPKPLHEEDITDLQEWMQRDDGAGLTFVARETVTKAIQRRAHDFSFHPVRNYLNSLLWDSKPRAGLLLPRYFGTIESDYTRTIGRMFLIACVARIFQPGCQCDYMPILEGGQGDEKSKACEILGGEWFSRCLPDIAIAGKDVSQHLRGKWIVELGELSAIARADSGQAKNFISNKTEKYRPSYGRVDVVEPRQCVLIGTTNKKVYLRDETGNRRYWPVRTTTINIDALVRERDQLFAEAIHLYRQGVQWWPDKAFEAKYIKPEQDRRFEADPWEDPILRYFDMLTSKRVTISQIAVSALGFQNNSRIGTADARRIRAILESDGWMQEPRQAAGRYWSK